ncbi:hypothetical protein [Actinomadura rupiterrae]|nr:hypothetical protein [Actinomadura rupiterrae]
MALVDACAGAGATARAVAAAAARVLADRRERCKESPIIEIMKIAESY